MPQMSTSAEHVMAIAMAESRFLRHYYLSTEHIFIGLCKCGDQAVEEAFRRASIDPVTTRRVLRGQLGPPQQSIRQDQMIITDCTRQLFRELDTALEEDHGRKAEPIDLLAALARMEKTGPMRRLRLMGIDCKRLVQETLEARRRGRAGVKDSATPFLDRFGRDLTDLAQDGKLSPMIGRRAELRRMVQILGRRQKNNVVLHGDPGVGKTCIVEGLALKCIDPAAPSELRDRRIVELTVAGLVAGTSTRGDFELRMQAIIDEATADSRIILFIDELHTLIGSGAAGGGVMTGADILKPALARGDLRCIGATTTAEYQKYVESDAALARRFQPVHVIEPPPSEAIEILQGLRQVYEAHHKAQIEDQAIEAAVRLSVRYLPDRCLPDKALDLIDEAASRLRLKSLTLDAEQIRQLQEGAFSSVTVIVRADDVARVVEEWTGVPVRDMEAGQAERLEHLEDRLRERVIGQDHAVAAVADVVRTSRAGLGDPNRPVGVFMFIGSTGVGKTELARALAEQLFGDDQCIVRMNLSEFTERHSVAKLIGSPPGYIGSDEGGQLTNAVRARPYCIVLLDEIEKAHSDVLDVFLQVFDEGRLTDGRGRTADFTNSIIIMTSNLGASHAAEFGFGRPHRSADDENRDRAEIRQELTDHFRPEFVNRIQEIVRFDPLDRESVSRILDKQLRQVTSQLASKGIELRMDNEARSLVIDRGYVPDWGARGLGRVVDRDIVRPLARMLTDVDRPKGNVVRVTVRDGELAMVWQDGDWPATETLGRSDPNSTALESQHDPTPDT